MTRPRIADTGAATDGNSGTFVVGLNGTLTVLVALFDPVQLELPPSEPPHTHF